MSDWHLIKVKINSEAVDATSFILEDIGSQGTSIVDREDYLNPTDDGFGEVWNLDPKDFPKKGAEVTGYFQEDQDLLEVLELLNERLTDLKIFGVLTVDPEITVEQKNETDWSLKWQEYYAPIQISRFLKIIPQWFDQENEIENGAVQPIILDPGLAFGTGQHPTSLLALQALEIVLREGDDVIDVGTGSGILAIGAARLGARRIRAYDLDEVAVKSAIENVSLNDLTDVISVEANNLLEGITGQVDVILANIVSDVILMLMPDVGKHLKDNGYLVLSGIIVNRKDEIEASFAGYGFELVQNINMNDWHAYILKKMPTE